MPTMRGHIELGAVQQDNIQDTFESGGSGSANTGSSDQARSTNSNAGSGHSISITALQILKEIAAGDSPTEDKVGTPPGLTAVPDCDDEEELQEQELAASSSARIRASWLLVWCHERCYKPERLELRVHLTDTAMKLSAGILRMKKAVKYEAWSKRTDNKLHVLITDWREAKPCVHAVEESQQKDSWPEVIIILCDLPKSHENAMQWASRQTATKTPIRVVFEDPEQQYFQVITQILQECYEKMLKGRPMLVPLSPGLLLPGTTERSTPPGIWEVESDVGSDDIRRAVNSGTIISL
mmetsp:Transcript_47895/g.111896  ORF Transcript_47895/g.111896 Transcript_47895/m.111896 type:complete len:296 (+) Transcript_47895:166-1053(+)